MPQQVIVLLLSGATIPLAFFPEGLRRVIDFLPFQSIYNAPLTILLKADPSPSDVLPAIGIQLLWAVGMTVAGCLF
ncbi:MAG: hypothetical protein IKN17_03230 [Ruminococcus sp.]|nr:hypothetical protein [Ruminococcus sp.]